MQDIFNDRFNDCSGPTPLDDDLELLSMEVCDEQFSQGH